MDPKDYPNFDEDVGLLHIDDEEQDLDIEVKDHEPTFLAGQTKHSLQLSPIKIVKNPDGTLHRAAMAGAALAKERRDTKQQASQKPVAGEDGEGVGPVPGGFTRGGQPEWKKKVFEQATFGKITSMTIREQRESLPIFKLRDTIIQAVEDNQILVVVGDTGSSLY